MKLRVLYTRKTGLSIIKSAKRVAWVFETLQQLKRVFLAVSCCTLDGENHPLVDVTGEVSSVFRSGKWSKEKMCAKKSGRFQARCYLPCAKKGKGLH